LSAKEAERGGYRSFGISYEYYIIEEKTLWNLI